MDGRGRLAQSLTWIARRRARAPNHAARRLSVQHDTFMARSLTARYARRVFMPILRIRVPRGIGLAATLLIIVGGLVFGYRWWKSVRSAARILQMHNPVRTVAEERGVAAEGEAVEGARQSSQLRRGKWICLFTCAASGLPWLRTQ